MEGQAPDRRSGGQPGDPSSWRISDHDRHQVAEVLRHAAGEGRLDLEELDERLEATYAAKTYSDLVPITADLPGATATPSAAPAPRPAHPAPTGPAARHGSSFSMMGECARRGVWEVPHRHVAASVMGSVVLDLREARFTAAETVIDAYAVMAGIDIIVNPYTRVVIDGIGVMGEFGEARARVMAELTADSPVVRIRGLALMASVKVKRKEMPDEPRKRLGQS